jgi:hypothetical protein
MGSSRLSFVKDPSVAGFPAYARDDSWFVATGADFDSTLIAGDQHVIDAVRGAEDLEASPIEPGDCLDSRGDTVNF